MKIIVAIAFVGILAALAAAGVFLLRDGRDGQPKTRAMARSLAVRVAVSIALFAFILIGYKLGWISPTGIPVTAR